MPTKKARVSWIIDPKILKGLQRSAEENRRGTSGEAEVAIEFYLKHKSKLKA